MFDTSRIQPFGLFPVDPLGVFVCKSTPGRHPDVLHRPPPRDRSPTPVRSVEKGRPWMCNIAIGPWQRQTAPGAKPLGSARVSGAVAEGSQQSVLAPVFCGSQDLLGVESMTDHWSSADTCLTGQSNGSRRTTGLRDQISILYQRMR